MKTEVKIYMRTLLYLLFLACLVPLLFFGAFAALLTVLAIVGVGWMVVFAGLLMGYPTKKLKRLRDARQLVTRRQESHLGKPDITTLPGNYRESDNHESFQGAAEVSGYHESLDAPSWLSSRLCG